MKNADHSTPLRDENEKTQMEPQVEFKKSESRKPARGDARDNESAQKKNRRDMGVAESHKTIEMEKHKRGTFP